MIALREEYHAKRCLTPLFCVDESEQAQALQGFRAAFSRQADIEAVSENLRVLHIWPGHPGCPCDGETREPTS